MSESFRIGALLALAGGFFDVYTYLCRGGVFANAQTGNMVLLGIAIAGGDWAHALHYIFPIAAFALGVAAAEWVKLRYKDKTVRFHWRQLVVLAEILLVAAVAFLPQAANTLVNTIVSFICALQVESFRKLRGSAFATTMCTGNLRSATEQFMRWRSDADAEALGESPPLCGDHRVVYRRRGHWRSVCPLAGRPCCACDHPRTCGRVCTHVPRKNRLEDV